MNLFLLLPLRAQERTPYRFEHISVDQGLSQSTVTSIIQDKTGFMWFGTGDGLNRYDGYTFKIFSRDPSDTSSLSDNGVSALLEDRSGVIWVGTGNGLNRFDDTTETFTHYSSQTTDAASISNNEIVTIMEEREPYSSGGAVLWVGTKKGLNRFTVANGKFERFMNDTANPASISADHISAMLRDAKGRLWIGTTGGGLNLFDDRTRTFKRIRVSISSQSSGNEKNNFSTDIIQGMYEDSQHRLWLLAQSEGLFRLNDDGGFFSFKQFHENLSKSSQLHGNSPTCITEDRQGCLWLGYRGFGIEKLVVNKDEIIKSELFEPVPGNIFSLSHHVILSMYVDRTGIMWIGTYGGGINKVNEQQNRFALYRNDPSNNNSLSSLSFRGIYEDEDGILWVGGYSGLNKWNRSENIVRRYRTAPGNRFKRGHPTSDDIYCFAKDPMGDKNILWIGTEADGLLKFDKSQETFELVYPNQENRANIGKHSILRLLADEKRRRLWIGFGTGIVLYIQFSPDGTMKFVDNLFTSKSGNRIVSLFQDTQGILWIGTDGDGLVRFDPDNEQQQPIVYNYQRDNTSGLLSDRIKSIHEDKLGNLWIGTDGGGLSNFDRHNNTFRHYTVADGLPSPVILGILEDESGNLWLSTNKGISRFTPNSVVFKNFRLWDGLQSEEFNTNSYYRCKHGEMFFGGINGLNAFFPDSIRSNLNVPPIVLTSFKKLNKETKLSVPLSNLSHLELAYDENMMTFGFAALEYTAPEGNQYAFMMEGFDNNWIYSGGTRTATYTNLDPGRYVFRVKASNNDQIWNEAGIFATVIILPPFWMTWWFRSVLVILCLSIGPIIYVRRVSFLKKEKERQQTLSHQLIQHVEAERKRIASELHDGLAQNILMIKNRTALALQASETGEQARNQLQEIAETAASSLDEIRSITYNLRPAHLERFGLTDTLQATVSHIASTVPQTFEYHVDQIDDAITKGNEIHFFRIIQEGINNIIKHSHASHVNIMIMKMAREIYISLKDNGKGFDVNSTKDQSTGLGLRGMEERVNILHGTLSITSSSEGTHIIISIPLKEQTNAS